jgi:hypothetical protein
MTRKESPPARPRPGMQRPKLPSWHSPSIKRIWLRLSRALPSLDRSVVTEGDSGIGLRRYPLRAGAVIAIS